MCSVLGKNGDLGLEWTVSIFTSLQCILFIRQMVHQSHRNPEISVRFISERREEISYFRIRKKHSAHMGIKTQHMFCSLATDMSLVVLKYMHKKCWVFSRFHWSIKYSCAQVFWYRKSWMNYKEDGVGINVSEVPWYNWKDITRWISRKYNFWVKLEHIIVLHISKA